MDTRRTDLDAAAARVQRFLTTYGTPTTPITTAYRYSDVGLPDLDTGAPLFAADVRALLDALAAAPDGPGTNGVPR